jgi:hypothetical protein
MAENDLTGKRVYPYRVLFAVEPNRWAAINLRSGKLVEVRDGHLRCLLRHTEEQLARDARRREFIKARESEDDSDRDKNEF